MKLRRYQRVKDQQKQVGEVQQWTTYESIRQSFVVGASHLYIVQA